MNNKSIITILVVVVLAIVGLMATRSGSDSKSITNDNGTAAIVYKSPTCGCCGVYASYMKKEGYDVDEKNIQDMSVIKQKFDIPYELESCHTTELGDYVVEGHIPKEAMVKLLEEQPDIKGIGMPGMPSGAPGMPGPKNGEFVIYEITHEGTRGDIFMTI